MEIAVILGIAAPVVAFVAFLCTIITAYQSLQFRHMVEEAENQVMDLLDEALQIMIPAGICKRISVNTNGMQLDNFDSKVFVKRQREIPILIDYPQDLSAEIASGERLYGELGVVSTEKYVEHYCRVEVELALKGSQKRSSSQKDFVPPKKKSKKPKAEADFVPPKKKSKKPKAEADFVPPKKKSKKPKAEAVSQLSAPPYNLGQ
ncbi:hypothetical protein Q1695_003434 [Nippostrongylus brasiliensis]|nr:hypothetical protein Q1695_003434 [Nippostrongylus brasiliensis]